MTRGTGRPSIDALLGPSHRQANDHARIRRHPEAANLTVGNPSGPGGRTGVLLVNLGTPDATDYWSMRRYLKEFLSDPRVIETNRVVWWFVLNFIVLTIRPQVKGRDYDKI